MIRIACQQLPPHFGLAQENKEMIHAAIVEALAVGSNLIVLPELVTSGYVFESESELRSIAIMSDDDVFEDWRRLIAKKDVVVVAGFPELGSDGSFYNSAAVVGNDGVRAIYRKNHLWDDEKRWFTPGGVVPPVIPTEFGKLGVLICYDLEFPETVRDLAVRGAEIIAVPTNWPSSPRPNGERPPEIGNAMVSARLSRVFIACCDRVGTERGVGWTGGSCVVEPDGWVLAERIDRDRGLVYADVDLSLARDKSLNRNNDVLGDRRPELYGSLTEGVSPIR